MSQSHEPSYYEIALTNRQVLIVFVVLLICVVMAFFSGVWVGQRDAPPPGLILAEEGATEPAAETQEGSAVGELHFFSDEEVESGDGPTLAQIADEPQQETTLLEDLGGGAAEPQTSVAVSEPRDLPPAPVERALAAEEAQSPATGGYVIQVFSSADEVQARKLLGQLTDGGYPAFLSPVEVGSQTMMRVRIGPYSQLANAETVAERIRREFRLDTWVTR